MKFSKLAVAIVAATALYTQSPVFASETSSAIRGEVIDASGLALANVTVEIIHQPTGVTKTIITSKSGAFRLRGLPVGGPYLVRIAGGTELKFENVNDLYLTLGEASKISLVAAPKVDIERIEVTGQLAMAGTYQKGPSSEFNSKDINNTAAISRDLKSVLQRDSRMVVDTTVDGGPALSIAGGNVRGNSLTVDGVSQNDDFGLNKNGYPGRRSPISLDAIEQLAVNVAPYDVTYGNFQGGNINIVTKSGTNEFHGTAFYYRSDDSITGTKSEGQELNLGNFSEDTYGFTLGGPIIKDKLFFFASYEKFDATKPYQFTLDNQNGVAEPNEKIGVTQADYDEIAQIAQDTWGYDIGAYDKASPEEDEKLLIKFDWFINDDHRASFTYQDNSGNTVRDFWAETFPNANWATSASNRYNHKEAMKTYSLQVFSDWTPDFSTEFKYARKEVDTSQQSLLDSNFAQFNIKTANGGSLYIGPDMFRQANALANDRDSIKFKADYYLNDDHLITFGIEYDVTSITNTFVFGSKGFTDFASVSDFENNLGFHVFQNALTGDVDDALDQFEYSTTTYYIQDEWTINDDLTLTAGARYTTYANNDKPVYNQNFVDRHGYDNQNNFDGLDLFEPRVGLNWLVDDDTVVRVGFGLFGGGAPNVWLSNSYGNDGIRKTFTGCFGGCFDGKTQPATITDLNNPKSLPNGGFGGPFNDSKPNGDTNSISPDFEIPSVYKLNFAIERRQDLGALGEDWLLSADVIFSDVKSAAYYKELNFEQIDTAPDGRPIYNDVYTYDLSLESTSKGKGQVWTFSAAKNFEVASGNIDLYIGYTYQNIEEVNPGNAFIAFEGYAMPANTDFQAEEVFTSEFEVVHRLTSNVTWTAQLFGDNLSVVSLAYTGREGRHYSPTMRSDGTFGGFELAGFADWDAFSSQSLYVPEAGADGDAVVKFAPGFDQAGFDAYVDSESCLKRGSVAKRHTCTSDWINRFDLHMMQEVAITGDHKIEITFDIENIGNMLNNDWGRASSFTQPFNAAVVDVTIENGKYVYSNFTKPEPTLAKIPSVWKAQLGLRYRF